MGPNIRWLYLIYLVGVLLPLQVPATRQLVGSMLEVGAQHLRAWLPPPPPPVATPVERYVVEAAQEFGVSPQLALAVLQVESGGQIGVVSPAGARGPMQVMPGTAAGIARQLGYQTYDLDDPQTNVRFGVYYLAQQIRKYGTTWGLAAYNCGPNCVDRYLARYPEARDWSWERVLAHDTTGIPLETQRYVLSIFAHQKARVSPPARSWHPVTTTKSVITARFDDRDCRFWGAQPNCQHYGTDFLGDHATPVYAPFPGTVTATGVYPENDPRAGEYIIYVTDDGAELYLGHLYDRPQLAPGTYIAAGTVVGRIRGDLRHVHVQLRRNGRLEDFEAYYVERTGTSP